MSATDLTGPATRAAWHWLSLPSKRGDGAPIGGGAGTKVLVFLALAHLTDTGQLDVTAQDVAALTQRNIATVRGWLTSCLRSGWISETATPGQPHVYRLAYEVQRVYERTQVGAILVRRADA